MKILKKAKFSKKQNRMKSVGDVEDALNYFKAKKFHIKLTVFLN